MSAEAVSGSESIFRQFLFPLNPLPGLAAGFVDFSLPEKLLMGVSGNRCLSA